MSELEKYPSFQKFRTALERGRLAATTLQGYIDSIQNFVQILNLKNPEYALDVIRREEDKEGFLNDAIDKLRRTLTDSRISNVFKAVRYWLRVNGVQVDWDSVIIPTGEAIVEDRIPTTEELKRLLTIANIRDQAIALVASTSGLRLNTLLTLSVGDVSFPFDIARIMVKRVYTIDGKEYRTGRKISKKRKFFVTFITPEARKALEAYLTWRREEGENITPESPLFTRMDKAGRGQFLEKHAFDVQWRKLLKRAHLDRKANGSPWNILHFHVLKKYAETKMIDAGVNRAYMEFFLGHKGGYLETNYFRGEEEKCIEEYRKAIPNLSVIERAPEGNIEAIAKKQALIIIAKNAGWTEEEIKLTFRERGATNITEEISILEAMAEGKGKHLIALRERGTNGGSDCAERFEQIKESELLGYLREGWQMVHRLQSGDVIIKKV